MKQFLKFTLASIVGSFITIFAISSILILIFVISISTLSRQEVVSISENSVLNIHLNYDISERSKYDTFDNFDLFFPKISKTIGLNDIIDNIYKAEVDNDITGIMLDLNNFSIEDYATVEAIRNALIKFKESGKFIFAHGNTITQKAYYLASPADKIFLVPSGNFIFNGMSAELMFFKNTLDKLEIEPQIFQYGKFKSATEPFKNIEMSPENEEQWMSMLTSDNDHILYGIGEERGIDYAELKRISFDFLIRYPEDAYNFGLIDSLVYEDEVYNLMKDEIGVDRSAKIQLVDLQEYFEVESPFDEPSTTDRIAVVYAEGEITGGEGNEETIGTENITDALRQARNNSRVKAVVLRINSPGGSALTADLIWREVLLTKQEKPVVVSMGSLAASGGYYIACPADTIVAQPNSLTGSIGVFGIIPNMQNFFNDKLGITFDRVKTGKYSDFIPVTRPLSEEEKIIIQKEIDFVYENFVNKVAEGRNMSFKEIDEIAQGRIYNGIQAKEIGLVDALGGLEDAIGIAAQMADISEYKLYEYPRLKNPIEKIFEVFTTEVKFTLMKNFADDEYKLYKNLEKIKNLQGTQMRIPFYVIWK